MCVRGVGGERLWCCAPDAGLRKRDEAAHLQGLPHLGASLVLLSKLLV